MQRIAQLYQAVIFIMTVIVSIIPFNEPQSSPSRQDLWALLPTSGTLDEFRYGKKALPIVQGYMQKTIAHGT